MHQVSAEDLDAHFRPNAGRQHVDAVDDGHRPNRRDARQLRRETHLGPEAIHGHPRTPLIPRLEVDDRLRHVQRGGVRRGIRARHLRHGEGDFRKRLQDLVLLHRILRVLLQGDARIGDGHEHQVALVERRHELTADPSRDKHRARKQQRRDCNGDSSTAECCFENRTVQPAQSAHDWVVVLLVKRAPE